MVKNKTEASGWTNSCVTEEEKTAYIHAYYAGEGVQLEPEKAAKNGGTKQVAKLILNRSHITNSQCADVYGNR